MAVNIIAIVQIEMKKKNTKISVEAATKSKTEANNKYNYYLIISWGLLLFPQTTKLQKYQNEEMT